MEQLISAIQYVISGHLFWASMGFTTAIAMFIGALVYDGEVPKAKRGIVSVLTYGFILCWTTVSRVVPIYFERIATEDPARLQMNQGQIFANPVTIGFVTLFWVLGIYLGVKLIHRQHKL